MRIKAENIGKRYKQQVVISGIDLDIHQPGVYVILGGNGSGKSTLLKILSGMLSPSRGKVSFFDGGDKIIPVEERYQHTAFAGPYHELVEEMRLREFLSFTSVFKPFENRQNVNEILRLMDLEHHAEKYIMEFSSGMKQRVKLSLALVSESPFVFLDEPVSHLDATAVSWYADRLSEAARSKIIFVASNYNPEEYPGAIREILVS
ncbi:MAG: ABC transporter ATP-binding protein [Cryomorphaceae bacterium]|nr:ABC transporter ATP-binding protein [Cryomorphaceae bacterium]